MFIYLEMEAYSTDDCIVMCQQKVSMFHWVNQSKKLQESQVLCIHGEGEGSILKLFPVVFQLNLIHGLCSFEVFLGKLDFTERFYSRGPQYQQW